MRRSEYDVHASPTVSGHSLQEANLPKRALNALLRNGARTLEEGAEWSDRDLLSLPHFGHASVAVLRKLSAGLDVS